MGLSCTLELMIYTLDEMPVLHNASHAHPYPFTQTFSPSSSQSTYQHGFGNYETPTKTEI